ncbi:LysR family transcriptional regulator [Aureimonas jatrophae]|jgi:DNA-binding transcriptional LysR family regulator|uniref:DNA-binding transcriptional regulator, LysR family n=1 Tax=Aureimonas jatrophae TaxID=1166073 RepID=A0A1H0CUI9_9HYPH|nr:LysR family transcriptional regulator [Aureimonas jatrophae]MBB3951655.1 DNA-binding transcriptional LysR family regulator [Aureimonas jatrophae]SDN61570.1 DNA-binding transcriptional regulator, LysR family [Aureimonas jatrophae]
MNWDDLRIFLAVARAGQILGAARRLGLNHATVGRRLDALETALGTRLFTRRPAGCEPTAEGTRLLAIAERMEREVLEAGALMGDTDIALSGTVRIGAPDGFGTSFLAARLGAFAERHPGITLQLVPVPRAFSISRREADIAVTVERPEEGRLVARKLTDYALGLYAARTYLARVAAPASLADLSAHPLIGHVDDLLYSPRLHYGRELADPWPSRFEISSALGQREAVAAGWGIGILHRFMAAERPELVPVLPAHEVRRSYWLVTHEDARGVARVRAVADFIAELVERERAIFG